MIYHINNSGIEMDAIYSEENIENIFLPLLRHLSRLQKEKGRRILVMLAAPPAAGKSTLAEFLKFLSNSDEIVYKSMDQKLTPITVIGMDGFHRYQDYLLTHTAFRDGKEIRMVDIKGAPITFDLALFEKAVARVAAGENCGWPKYDRLKHNPQENAIFVEGDIVLLEGNYLLLEEEGWKNLRKYADYTIKITAKEEQLRNRLVERKMSTGTSREEAEHFVDFSDLYNARTCLAKTGDADLCLELLEDGTYALKVDQEADRAGTEVPGRQARQADTTEMTPAEAPEVSTGIMNADSGLNKWKDKAFIWDLDGTLLDSYGEIVSSVMYTMGQIGWKTNPKEVLDHVIRTSVKDYLLMVADQTGESYEQMNEICQKLHISKFKEVKAMPGGKEILSYLHDQGAHNFVFTHRERSTFTVLENVGLLQYFDEIISIEDGFPRKPTPEGVNYFVEKYHLDKDQTYYVGDRRIDLECAKNAGIHSILFIPSYSCMEATGLEDIVIHKFDEMKSDHMPWME